MSIRRDKRSIIQPCYIIDYTDENGIRRRKHVRKTKTESMRVYIKLLEEIDKIKSGESTPSILLKDLIWKYQIDSEKIGHSVYTIRRIRNASDAFTRIIDENIWISDINIRMIENFIHIRTREKTPRGTRIRPISINTELKHLKAMFNWAIKMGYLSKSPFVRISMIRVEEIPIRFLTNGEISTLFKILLDSNNKDVLDIFTFYLQTGARRSELLPPKLTWDDIDIHRKQIILSGKKGKRRTVPLNSSLIDILLSRSTCELPLNFSPDQISRIVKMHFKKAKIRNASVHTLRKTCGALLIQAGVDIFRVSKWLGHSSVLVTEKHYVDLLPNAYVDISNKLGEIGNQFINQLMQGKKYDVLF